MNDVMTYQKTNWTARDAAMQYAHDRQRTAKSFTLPDDKNPLAIEFQLVNGLGSWYRAEWSDQHNGYVVGRVDLASCT